MPYAVRVDLGIANLRSDQAGRRRRAGRTFTRRWTYLSLVAPEVQADPHLEVKEVTEDEIRAAGGRVPKGRDRPPDRPPRQGRK